MYLMRNSNAKEVNFSDPCSLYKHLKIDFDNLLSDSNISSKKCLSLKKSILWDKERKWNIVK